MMIINIQPVERQVPPNSPLEVHSVFYTIQGEGPLAGTPAVFIRLAGCNLQCPLCDTDYTSHRKQLSNRDIGELVRIHSQESKLRTGTLVVITGGEPFRQDIAPLVRHLIHLGYRVQIETNGTLCPIDFPWDSVTVVCSPKTGKLNPLILAHIAAYKYIIRAGDVHHDGLPLHALDHPANPYPARPPLDNKKPVYVQPADMSKSMGSNMDAQIENEKNLLAAIKSAMTFGYTLQLQIHKLIGVE